MTEFPLGVCGASYGRSSILDAAVSAGLIQPYIPPAPLLSEEKILRLFRSTRAYRRMSTEKRLSTLLAAHFWADAEQRGLVP